MDDYYLHDFSKDPQPEPADRQPVNPVSPEPVQPRKRGSLRWVLIAVAIIAAAAFYIRYCTPAVTNAVTDGYITRLDKRGLLLKTWEGEMISQAALTDTTHLYARDFTFSVDNDSVARLIQQAQGTGRPIRLTYKIYRGTLPWRGASRHVATGIE